MTDQPVLLKTFPAGSVQRLAAEISRIFSRKLDPQMRISAFRIERDRFGRKTGRRFIAEKEITLWSQFSLNPRIVAHATIKPENSLQIVKKEEHQGLGNMLRSILYNENSGYVQVKNNSGEEERTYHGLNPWAHIIPCVFLVKGLKIESDKIIQARAAWYNLLVEPYIRQSGFDLAAVHGECIDMLRESYGVPEFRFWRSLGFGEAGYALMLNDAYNEETRQKTVYFKKL